MAENQLNIKCSILLFGGSAGSLEILLKILPELKKPLSYPIVIVLHRKNSYDSTLPELLASKTKIPVSEIEDKDEMHAGHIYIAPPDYHLLLESTSAFSLDASEKINFSRPSIDVTFESAADIFGNETVAVLLSGANADGTVGLQAIKKLGGTTVVQDPVSAQVPFMPQHAIVNAEIDYILNTTEIVHFLQAL